MKTVLLLGGPAAGQRVEVHGNMRTVYAGPDQESLYNLTPMCSHGEVHWFGVLDGADPLALLTAGYAPQYRAMVDAAAAAWTASEPVAPGAEFERDGVKYRHTGKHPGLAAPYGAAADDTRRMDFLENIVMRNGQTLSANRDRDSTTSSPTYGDLPTVCLFTIPSQHVRGIGFRGAVDEAMAKVRP